MRDLGKSVSIITVAALTLKKRTHQIDGDGLFLAGAQVGLYALILGQLFIATLAVRFPWLASDWVAPTSYICAIINVGLLLYCILRTLDRHGFFDSKSARIAKRIGMTEEEVNDFLKSVK